MSAAKGPHQAGAFLSHFFFVAPADRQPFETAADKEREKDQDRTGKGRKKEGPAE